MTITVQFIDEEVSGGRRAEFSLDMPQEKMTAFDLIRERVYQQIQDQSQKEAAFRRSIFEPEMTEAQLNDRPRRSRLMHDWQRLLSRIVEAFKSGQVILFVDDRQVMALDETVIVSTTTKVTFLRLVPLAGG